MSSVVISEILIFVVTPSVVGREVRPSDVEASKDVRVVALEVSSYSVVCKLVKLSISGVEISSDNFVDACNECEKVVAAWEVLSALDFSVVDSVVSINSFVVAVVVAFEVYSNLAVVVSGIVVFIVASAVVFMFDSEVIFAEVTADVAKVEATDEAC